MISSIFRNLIYIPFVNILVALIVWLPGHSAAAAIIVFTILLRLILLIPNRKALENQKKIGALKPEIDALTEQYKDDPQKRAETLMAVYKENNISPFGSCLPLLIQLPILIILYRILQEGFTEHTLSVIYPFIPRPGEINNFFFGIDLTQPDRTFILPVLATGLQFLQSLAAIVGAKKSGQGKMPGQGLLLTMPLTILLIAPQISGGAVLYWVTSSLFGLGQQLSVNRSRIKVVGTDQIKLPAGHNHNSKKGGEGGGASKGAASKGASSKRVRGGVKVTVRRPK